MGYLISDARFDDIIVESVGEAAKTYYIEGVFAQAAVPNGNNRVYPPDVLLPEIQRYTRDLVMNNRAVGELNHPKTPGVDLERVCIKIEKLVIEGNNVYGRARVTKDAKGPILYGLLDDGIQVGVSTRGVGKVNKKTRNVDDFYLTAIDVVHSPSAPEAFVQGIMEGREWHYHDGTWSCEEIERIKERIETAKRPNLKSVLLEEFSKFMGKLSK